MSRLSGPKTLTQMTPDPKSPEHNFRRAARLGYGAIGVFLCTFAAWGMTASIGGAVISSGQFVAESNLKKVQHQNGGIVAGILVREGDLVEEGDLLIRLDETVLKANLQVILGQIDEIFVRMARLEAERDEKPALEFAPAPAGRADEPELAKLKTAEARLFAARAIARQVSRAQFEERIGQFHAEITGLNRQREAREREAALTARELVGVRELYRQNLVQINRLSQLERDASALEGQRGLLAAQIVQAEHRIAENRLNILQITDTLQAEVMKELRENQTRLAELRERRIAAEDQLKRVDIRAPVKGIVHQLSTHTLGGVVAPGEAILMIVPSNDQLTLEARILPTDFDQVRLGQPAKVKIHAFNQRTTPELDGTVSRIASDVVRDQQSGQSFYSIRIQVPRGEFERLAPFRIIAGMQADVFLQTGERSPAAFLIKPLTDQFAKAFRER